MDSGLARARGSACSKERRVAELLDTVAQRKDDGERDYGDGAAVVASAMAWESEGERRGENGCVHGVRATTWGSSRPVERRGEEAGRRAAAWRALVSPSSTCLPARRRQAARWSGCWAGPARWDGWWAARLVPSLYFYLSFYLFCSFVDFLKIPRQLQKSSNCSCPLFSIYTTWNILV